MRMRNALWHVIATVCGTGIIVLAMSGCATQSPQAHTSATKVATSAPVATSALATPPPVSQATLDLRTCSANGAKPSPPTYVSTVGDFSFTAVTKTSPYLGYALPSGLPTTQPYEVTASTPRWPDKISVYAPAPGETMGYEVTVCNKGTKAHTISAVTIKVASFQAASGSQLNVGMGCDAPYPPGRGGCGGGCECADNSFAVTWPASVKSGDVPISVTQTSRQAFEGTEVWPNLPVTLSLGQGYTFHIVTPQVAAGTFTFSLGIQTEVGTVFGVGASPATYFAPHGQVWSGAACANSATMQAQMTSGKQYLCPGTH